ncbi:MAG: hypothetical protein JWN86_442 [Planctomycetota bacterium]|nr:hypothetical protein [Planctomycetota bacterium]
MTDFRGRLRAAEAHQAGPVADPLDAVFLVAEDARPGPVLGWCDRAAFSRC